MLLRQYADLCLFNFLNNSYYNLFINNKTKKIFCFLESLCPNHANIKMQTTYDTTHFMLPRFGLLKDYPKLEIGLMILNRNPENIPQKWSKVEIYTVLWEKLRKPDWWTRLLVVFPGSARKSNFKKHRIFLER